MLWQTGLQKAGSGFNPEKGEPTQSEGSTFFSCWGVNAVHASTAFGWRYICFGGSLAFWEPVINLTVSAILHPNT